MKLRSLLSLSAAVLLSVLTAVAQQTGKIHGKVLDPTGMPRTAGTVSLSQDNGHTLKYTFPIDGTGAFKGDGIVPGTYTLILKFPDTPEGKFVDQIDNVKIAADTDLPQDVDMSRKEYLDKMTPDQKKQVEEFKKKNAEILKTNAAIKNLNADLAEARTDNKDKKYAEAEALMTKDTAMNPPNSELLYYELGMAQLGQKKWDDATTNLKKALELATASKKPSPELIAGAHSALGEVYARSNKAPEAAAEYDEAAKIFPAKAAIYYQNEAVVFQNVNNNDAMAAAADKAIATDPKAALPYYLKGQALIPKATTDPKGNWVLPPGMTDAYQKYLELAPTGPYSADVKAILDTFKTPVQSSIKNSKTKK